MIPKDKKNSFLIRNPEKADFNQYWYSPKTIQFILEQLKSQKGGSIAFLSTPSIYFSLDEEMKKTSKIFEFDKKFEKDANFVFYDFSHPEQIPIELENHFDFVLIDPPFITKDVWTKYSEAIKYISKKNEKGEINSRILLSSIDENAPMLAELLNVKKRVFRPSIPHLIYQYSFFSNYEDLQLEKINEEIGY